MDVCSRVGEQRERRLFPMVLRGRRGTVRWIEEEEQREREWMGMCRTGHQTDKEGCGWT